MLGESKIFLELSHFHWVGQATANQQFFIYGLTEMDDWSLSLLEPLSSQLRETNLPVWVSYEEAWVWAR
jgi:hypothetical protein